MSKQSNLGLSALLKGSMEIAPYRAWTSKVTVTNNWT